MKSHPDEALLKGREVDDWLNQDDSAKSRSVVQPPPQLLSPSRAQNLFQNFGFTGDEDEVEDDEGDKVGKEPIDDDWMFQTFEKKSQRDHRKPLGINQEQSFGFENISKQVNEFELQDFLEEEDAHEEQGNKSYDCWDEDENLPSINQFGTETGGYTNMLDKWLSNMK